jgi:integrase
MANSDEMIHLRDGEVVLYKRGEIPNWQARFKVGNGNWHRISTKTADLDRAKAKATDAYDRARFMEKEGLPQVTRRFDSIAKLAIAEMEKALEAGQGKKTYTTYIQVINRHLIPFFGKKQINQISYQDFVEFDAWRLEQFKRPPKASTITNHISALNRIYDIAIGRGWITKSQVPELKNRGKKGVRRPDFTFPEWIRIQRNLREFPKLATKDKGREMRVLLRDYVLFLRNTGIRHGTEAHNIKWKHIEWYVHTDKQKYLRITVSGKTGQRELIARHNVRTFLERIQQRFENLKKMTFDELLKARVDEYVFRLPDGSRTRNLDGTFEQFLSHYDLLRDKLDQQNRTLYSLRHTYATMALVQDGISIHDLARQMGTSVAMIEKHYSHLTPSMKADVLAGRRFDQG